MGYLCPTFGTSWRDFPSLDQLRHIGSHGKHKPAQPLIAAGVSLGYFYHSLGVLSPGSLGRGGRTPSHPVPVVPCKCESQGKGHCGALAGTAELGIFLLFLRKKELRKQQSSVSKLSQQQLRDAARLEGVGSLPSAPSRWETMDTEPGAVLGISWKDGWQGEKGK